MNKTKIIQLLRTHQPILLAETPRTAAVMIILLLDETDQIKIVLTKRSSALPTYAGHYSFPGGMRDLSDGNLYTTAQRETHEELDLPETAYQYIGQLDDFMDRYGDLVRPFVVSMDKNFFEKQHKISSAEVASLYFFPLEKLSEIESYPPLQQMTHRIPSYSYTDGDVVVWGLTAAILVQIYNVITGSNKPLGNTLYS